MTADVRFGFPDSDLSDSFTPLFSVELRHQKQAHVWVWVFFFQILLKQWRCFCPQAALWGHSNITSLLKRDFSVFIWLVVGRWQNEPLWFYNCSSYEKWLFSTMLLLSLPPVLFLSQMLCPCGQRDCRDEKASVVVSGFPETSVCLKEQPWRSWACEGESLECVNHISVKHRFCDGWWSFTEFTNKLKSSFSSMTPIFHSCLRVLL